MFARVQSGQIEPGEVEVFSRMIRDDVLPRARGLKGFQGGYWLVDRSTGHMLGVTLFESQAALRASEEQAARIRQEASAAAGLPQPAVEEFEVVASSDMVGLRAA